MKFRTELWRIAKYILITGAVNIPLSILYGALINALAAGSSASTGTWLTVMNYAHLLISTLALTLLHRYFTFRATEKWYIAVPFMLVAAIAWQLLRTLPMAAAAKAGQDVLLTTANLLSGFWFVLQYLLQRCVIYCHTTDTNGWYKRFHPTNEE